MTFAQKVAFIRANLEKSLPKVGTKILATFGDEVSQNIRSSSKITAPAHRPGISDALQMSSGRLLRSWSTAIESGKKDRTVTQKFSGGKFTWELASKVPYARIQDKGGAIPATPKMVKFFWAMQYKLGKGSADTFWRGMAIHAMMKRAIIIKPTNYLKSAQQSWNTNVNKAAHDFLLAAFNEAVAGV